MAAIAKELDGLLSQTAQAASLLIRMAPACKRLRWSTNCPSVVTPDGVQVELGAFYSGEVRRLVVDSLLLCLRSVEFVDCFDRPAQVARRILKEEFIVANGFTVPGGPLKFFASTRPVKRPIS